MYNVHRNLLMANSAETVKSLAAIYIFSKLSAFKIQVEFFIDWKCLWVSRRTKVTFGARNQFMIRNTFVCSRLFQAELESYSNNFFVLFLEVALSTILPIFFQIEKNVKTRFMDDTISIEILPETKSWFLRPKKRFKRRSI